MSTAESQGLHCVRHRSLPVIFFTCLRHSSSCPSVSYIVHFSFSLFVSRFPLPLYFTVNPALFLTNSLCSIFSTILVIFVIAPVDVVRDIMLKAYRAGYINGEYVFFSVHLVNNRWRFGDASWRRVNVDHEDIWEWWGREGEPMNSLVFQNRNSWDARMP